MSAQSSPQEFKLFPEPGTLPALQLSNTPLPVRYLIACAITGIATVVAAGLDSTVTIPNLSLVFVVPVLVTAVAFGLGPSLCSAILGALAYNFFLTEPRFTLRVDDPANIWAIGLLFIVGVIASAVASTARRRADDAALASRQAALVRSCGRELAAADTQEAIFSRTADALEALFKAPVILMSMSENSVDLTLRRGGIEPAQIEIESARSSLTTGNVSVADVYPFDASRFDFWPVMTSAGNQAVIGLAFDRQERPPQPSTLVETVASLMALALDRQHLRESDCG